MSIHQTQSKYEFLEYSELQSSIQYESSQTNEVQIRTMLSCSYHHRQYNRSNRLLQRSTASKVPLAQVLQTALDILHEFDTEEIRDQMELPLKSAKE
jgi:hypothetical protein